MRVAFSIWNERIAPLFDVSQRLLVLDIQDGKIVAQGHESLMVHDPMQKLEKLAGMDVQALVCGAISLPVAEMAAACEIETFPFIAGDVKRVIAAYLDGSLSNQDLAMPGCCGRRARMRQGRSCRRAANNNGPFIDGRASIEARRAVMPKGDGTGPQGQGPGTGRGRGGCGKGPERPAQPGQGRGTGRGAGQGAGAGSVKGRGQGRKGNQ